MRSIRIFGPYQQHRKWRLVARYPDGSREVFPFDSEASAKRAKREMYRAAEGHTTIEQAIAQYERHLLKSKGNKSRSVSTTIGRLRTWLAAMTVISEATAARIAAAYEQRCGQVLLDAEGNPRLDENGKPKTIAVDTHRNELAEVKTFFAWCVTQRWLQRNPAADVQPVGKRRRGKRRRSKRQLRLGEAQTFGAFLIERASGGDESALALAVALELQLRAGEIVQLRARDVDQGVYGGRKLVILWVADDDGQQLKSDAARRQLIVESPKLAELLRQRAKGRLPGAWLFPSPRSQSGHRGHTWLRKRAAKLCEAAGVEYVCPHGLRGSGATLAELDLVLESELTRRMGHESATTAEQAYLAPGTRQLARARRGARVIGGGAAVVSPGTDLEKTVPGDVCEK